MFWEAKVCPDEERRSLPSAITAVSRDHRAAWTARLPVVSAWQRRGSELRQIWNAGSCFQTARDGYSQPS